MRIKWLYRQRIAKDIWQQLYEFPIIETSKEEESRKIIAQAEKLNWLQKKNYEVISISPLFKQQLSHQLIAGQFIKIRLKKKINHAESITWATKKELKKFAFPKFINQYLESARE